MNQIVKPYHGHQTLSEDTEIFAKCHGNIESDKPIVISIRKQAGKIHGGINAPNATVILQGGWGWGVTLQISDDVIAKKIIKSGKVKVFGKVYENGKIKEVDWSN